MQREIQSVEVSCLLHATEDEGRVADAIMARLGISAAPEQEQLEGHFGNRILRLRWHLVGEEAWDSFERLIQLLGTEGKNELMREVASCLDEHGSLFLRLDKQSLVRGSVLISHSDPVRVKVKPRGYLMRGEPAEFYRRLLEART